MLADDRATSLHAHQLVLFITFPSLDSCCLQSFKFWDPYSLADLAARRVIAPIVKLVS